LATALNPVLGYDRAARLAKEALDTNKSIRELVQEKDLLDKDTMEQLFDADRMTRNPDESSKE
jgi:aspartate ammonia-lyase